MNEESLQKKRVLLFGATGFMGKSFISLSGDEYDITSVTREHVNFEQYVDFMPMSLRNLLKDDKFDACLFFQGLGPKLSTRNMITSHFEKMMRVNVASPAVLVRQLIERQNLNEGCSVVFLSSIAAKKGSYDCAYAASKAALGGLIHSLSNEFVHVRFNTLSLGLVNGSPTHTNMSPDFVEKHRKNMFNNQLIDVTSAINAVKVMINSSCMARADIALDGGYRI